jgi:hypothetical protein
VKRFKMVISYESDKQARVDVLCYRPDAPGHDGWLQQSFMCVVKAEHSVRGMIMIFEPEAIELMNSIPSNFVSLYRDIPDMLPRFAIEKTECSLIFRAPEPVAEPTVAEATWKDVEL